MLFWGASAARGLWKGGREACFAEEPPLRGADGRKAEKHAFLGSFRCAGLMEGE